MSRFFIDLETDFPNRFDMAKFMEFNVDNYDPLTSAFFDELLALPEAGRWTVQGEDGRPDLLSYRIYGDVQYWWLLLLYNNRLEYSDFVTGDVFKYPSLSQLEAVYFRLKASQTAAEG